MPFRITRARTSTWSRETDEAGELLDLVEQELRQRKFETVCVSSTGPADPWILQFLARSWSSRRTTLQMPAILDYTTLRFMRSCPSRARYEPWTP